MPFSTDLPTPPAPLVPPDTDVSVLAGFMLNVDHLLASELVAIGTPEECWAALMLWCRAWKQIPAGSLPNDERVLASFSGAGRRWPKVREVALRGFVLCTDGRLYHRFLCQDVLRASARQTVYRDRRETDRKRLSEWRAKRRGNGGDTPVETRVVALETRQDRTGQDVVGKKEPNGSSFPTSAVGLSIDPNGSISLTADAARARKPSDTDFEAFWQAYPRKVAKQKARLKYEIARRSASADELLNAALRYANAFFEAEPDEKKFIPYPAAWLHQGRWQDEDIEVTKRRKSPLEKLYEGAWRAANELDEQEQAGDRGDDRGPSHPLLDRR